jgi:threonine/homoserine/homoserine lactone efflux protein
MMLEFIVASIVVELTPGPNMTWLAVTGATRGRAIALSAVAGICIGLSCAAVVAGAGLAVLFSTYPQLFQILRWAGAIYLLYLAWDAWRDATDVSGNAGSNAMQAFAQGLASNLLNPKAYLFYVAVVPRFMQGLENTALEFGRLALLYVAIATVIHAAIAVAAGSISDWLRQSPSAVLLRKGLALVIAAAAVWFYISAGVIK